MLTCSKEKGKVSSPICLYMIRQSANLVLIFSQKVRRKLIAFEAKHLVASWPTLTQSPSSYVTRCHIANKGFFLLSGSSQEVVAACKHAVTS